LAPRNDRETGLKADASKSGEQAADRAERWRGLLEANLGVPFTQGNELVRLKNGDEIFPAMLEAIDVAERTIDFLTFVYWTGDVADRFARRLADAARRGVRTRVLLDSVGAHDMRDELVAEMKSAGVNVGWFRPVRFLHIGKATHRTHRKVLVCDAQVGFTGGVGIAEEWEGDATGPSSWRESHFRVRGPAVAGLGAAFLGNWLESESEPALLDEEVARQAPVGSADVQLIRSSAAIGWSDVAIVYRTVLSAARERLRITTPYFVPDEEAVRLLRDAAARGVSVTVLMPGPHIDQRLAELGAKDVFEELLEAGVELRLFQPTMLHAKVLTVDGVLAVLGSANFNHRSMCKDDEIVVNVLDERLVRQLDEDFERDVERSRAVDLDEWQDRGLAERALETLSRPFRGEM